MLSTCCHLGSTPARTTEQPSSWSLFAYNSRHSPYRWCKKGISAKSPQATYGLQDYAREHHENLHTSQVDRTLPTVIEDQPCNLAHLQPTNPEKPAASLSQGREVKAGDAQVCTDVSTLATLDRITTASQHTDLTHRAERTLVQKT